MTKPVAYDLVDIKELLEYPNLLVKTKGFQYIARHILECQLDPRTDKEYRKVLFDCFYKYGDVPLENLIETIPTLLRKIHNFSVIMTREEILAEFTQRIDQIESIQRAFPAVLNACIPSFSNFLTAAARIDPDTLTTMFVGAELQTEHYRFILVLIFSGILNDEQKRRLGNMIRIAEIRELFLRHHPNLYLMEERARYDPEKFLRECPAGELETHPLHNMDFIQRLHLMHERPSILRNPNIGRHILYMPFMFLMIQHVPVMSNLLKTEPKYVQQNEYIKIQFGECQRQIDFTPPDFYQCTLNMERAISDVVTKKIITEFVKFLEFCPEHLQMFHKPHLLPTITALIPHVPEKDDVLRKRIVEWVVRVLKESPWHADSFMLFFIGVFSVPYYPVDQWLIMDCLVEMSTTKHSYIPAARFIGLLTDKNMFAVKAYECLARLAVKYPSTIEMSAKKIRFSQDDSEKIFRANMHLAKECCLATDDNDKFIAQISECLKDNGFRLAAAVDALYDLVNNDVLELVSIRKQLQKKVKSFGNQQAFASYCHILSLGAIQQDEESDEDFQNRKITYIQELHDYTKLESQEVASSAWKALGEYLLVDIESALGAQNYSEKFVKSQCPGLLEFLKKQLDAEKESYQRPLYNTLAQSQEPIGLLAKVDGYRDHLGAKNKEEPWFWSSTLPLGASLLQLAAPSSKAQQTVRLLKGCLHHVPTADSQEGMLRLMAAWRLCVREALNALAESKSNDLLWARDQICNEGRLSLTQKAESVDNIMMMLTVLVEAIEEKLRSLDDPNQIDEIARAQKPWTISVFEFVATRLPKQMKERREQRVNPIYQVLTQSNKSSLHTAIFCARLLKRHPAVEEFYRNEPDLGIAKDPIFEEFFGKEIAATGKSERTYPQITLEAYGVDPLTAQTFSEENGISAESTGEMAELTADTIPSFFAQLVKSSKPQTLQIQLTNKKLLEKLFQNGSDAAKRQIYEGLAELALISGTTRKRACIPNEKLSDGTILKGLLQCFDEKLGVEKAVLKEMLRVLPDHKRADGRYLPPVDWMKVLERAGWKEMAEQEPEQKEPEQPNRDHIDPPKPQDSLRLSLIKLACEQAIPEVLFHFSKAQSALTTSELLVIAEHFKTVLKLLPRRQLYLILGQLTSLARQEGLEKSTVTRITQAISTHEKDPIVHGFLTQDLPKLAQVIGASDPILIALKEPQEFAGAISRGFDVWLEARSKMNIKRIYEILAEETEELKLNAMFALISLEARNLNSRQKIEKCLDVITVSRIIRSSNGDLTMLFNVFLSIIVSLNDEVDIPVCWFGNENDVIKILNAARKPFFRALLECTEMRKHAKHIGSFLRFYVEGDESEFYDSWQKSAAQDMLCTLLAAFGTDALESLHQEDDFFWQSILPVE